MSHDTFVTSSAYRRPARARVTVITNPGVKSVIAADDDLDIPLCLRRSAKVGQPAHSAGPDDDLGDIDGGWR
jgi:hypothetical protein